MRYIPNNQAIRESMLEEIGVKHIDDLFTTIPSELQIDHALAVSAPKTEFSLLKDLKNKASRCASDYTSFLGAGAYQRFIPSAVEPIVQRAEFLTCYTPYQPEVSQGTLQMMFEFQTLLSGITGMEVANGSMYEGASALAEAVLMAKRIKPKLNRVLMSLGVHPEYQATLKTYLHFQDFELVEIPLNAEGTTDLEVLEAELAKGALTTVLQVVNHYGMIEDQEKVSDLTHAAKALYIASVVDLSVLGLIKAPGDYGADIVVGEGQSLGLPVAYGGPYLGVFATRDKYVRKMPGRLSGQTKDSRGNRAFCLTLSTREQHIRREKATSNICSNQALCALWVTVYLSLLGKKGFKELGQMNYQKSQATKKALTAIDGVKLRYTGASYNEFVIELPKSSAEVLTALEGQGILGGVPLSRFDAADDKSLLICTTEIVTNEEIQALATAIKGAL